MQMIKTGQFNVSAINDLPLAQHGIAKESRGLSKPQIPELEEEVSSAEDADMTGRPSFDDLDYTPDKTEDGVPDEMEANSESEELLTAWGMQFFLLIGLLLKDAQTCTTAILCTWDRLCIVLNISWTASG